MATPNTVSINWQHLYNKNRAAARARGIDWQFTLEEYKTRWQDYIQPDGTKDPYVLCRRQEPGPYSFANTYIGTALDNAHDASRNGRLKSNQYDVWINSVYYTSISEASRQLQINYDSLMYIARKPQPVVYKGKTYTIQKGSRQMRTSKCRLRDNK